MPISTLFERNRISIFGLIYLMNPEKSDFPGIYLISRIHS